MKSLADVCQIRPPKTEARRRASDADLVSFVPMEDLGVGQKTFTATQTKPLGEVFGSYTYFADGDVLLAKITPCFENGKLGIAEGLSNGLGFGSSEYVVFRPSKLVEKDWLYYFLSRAAFREEGAKRMSGAVGHKRVSKEFIESHLIPLPPRAEQKRIIAILDEAFEGIDTALANAEKNLASARELFDCQVSSIFINRGIGWQDRKLDQVCIVERGSSPRPIQDYFTTEINGVNWIKIGDTEEGGKYVYKTVQKITPEGAKKSRRVDEGDFILTNSMSFGRPYIMKTSGYIHDGWFVLRLNDTIDSEYFYYLLSSSFVQSQFAQLASGSVVKNISGDLVKKAVLPIPPLAQQQVIVSQLLKASSETTRLEAIYQQKVSSLERLRQAILQKAFAGKLTARSANALPQAAE